MRSSIITLVLTLNAFSLTACANGQPAPNEKPGPSNGAPSKPTPTPSKPQPTKPANEPTVRWKSEPDPMPWRTAESDARPSRLATAIRNVINESKEAAAAGLVTFAKLVTEQNASAMGFRSAAEAKSGAVGAGFAVV